MQKVFRSKLVGRDAKALRGGRRTSSQSMLISASCTGDAKALRGGRGLHASVDYTRVRGLIALRSEYSASRSTEIR